MALLYCVGLPLFALKILHTRKVSIQKVQEAEKSVASHVKTPKKAKTGIRSRSIKISGIFELDPLLGGISPL